MLSNTAVIYTTTTTTTTITKYLYAAGEDLRIQETIKILDLRHLAITPTDL